MGGDSIQDTVRDKYGQAALNVVAGKRGGCCGGDGDCDPVTSKLYDPTETAALPHQAVLASLGCGNPTALAALHPGGGVPDLRRGRGCDVPRSARRVGPAGNAHGPATADLMP